MVCAGSECAAVVAPSNAQLQSLLQHPTFGAAATRDLSARNLFREGRML
jgi:hypothetical protein